MDMTGPEFYLPCPSPTDYAALPLYMQRLAEQIETEHVTLRSRISAAYRPATAIWNRSVPAISSGSSTTFEFFGSNLVFFNFLSPTGAVPTLGPSSVICPQAGMWELGWWCNATPTGAFTAGSLRIMHVGVGRQDPNGGQTTIIADLSRYTTTSNFAGGDYWSNAGTFFVPQDFDRVSCSFLFEHTNAASTVAITQITAWLRYVGTADPLEVVL